MEHQNHHPHQERPIIENKTSFYLGLAAGIAAISLLGLLAFSVNYIKGDDNNFAKNTDSYDDNGTKEVGKDGGAVAPAPTGAKVTVKVDSKDQIRGNKDAKITIVEFSDIQCPYCSTFHNSMKQAMAKYGDQIRWVFKHFPLDSIHPYARKAAEATECAGEQKKFWEYTDKLYENQASINNDYLKTAASDLKLDTKKFNECLDSGKFAKKVDADFKYGQELGVRGTPGSFINGTSIPGAVPFSTLEEMIKAEQ